jgi:hypothetical protein
MQYWESILKNDAILGIDIKNDAYWKSILKNDAILESMLKNDAIHLVIKGSMGSRSRSVSGSVGGVRGHKVRGHKKNKISHY